MHPGKDLNLYPSFRRVPWSARTRQHEKRLVGGGTKNTDVQKSFILRRSIHRNIGRKVADNIRDVLPNPPLGRPFVLSPECLRIGSV